MGAVELGVEGGDNLRSLRGGALLPAPLTGRGVKGGPVSQGRWEFNKKRRRFSVRTLKWAFRDHLGKLICACGARRRLIHGDSPQFLSQARRAGGGKRVISGNTARTQSGWMLSNRVVPGPDTKIDTWGIEGIECNIIEFTRRLVKF